VDHAAADGQGAKRIVSRLAKRYSEDVDAACDDASAASPNRSGVRLLRRFSVGTLYHELRNATPPRPTWGIPRRGDDPGRRRFEIRTVDAERFSALRAWAKQRGATVNDVALTAWYRALFAELQPAEGVPMAINVSFDMRRYLEDGCEIPAAMNLSSTETAMLALVDGEPFETTLSRVVRETARLKEGRPGLGQAVKLELAGHLLSLKRLEGTVVEPMRRGRRAGLSYPFLSNFGVIAEEDVTFGEARTTRALMLGPAGHAPFLMLGVSSYRGELSLAIGYCDGEMSGEAIGRIADSAAADLLGAGLHPADGG
jgi:NRPS condensation-like uncharacterized protein